MWKPWKAWGVVNIRAIEGKTPPMTEAQRQALIQSLQDVREALGNDLAPGRAPNASESSSKSRPPS